MPTEDDLRRYAGDVPSLQYLYGLEMGRDGEPLSKIGWSEWHYQGWEDAMGELNEEDN